MNIFSLFGKKGFVKSNLKVYFYFRKSGANQWDALMTCLESRYPFEPYKITEVKGCWEGGIRANLHVNKPKQLTEKEILLELVTAMYIIETSLHKVDTFKRCNELKKLEGEFNEQYDLMEQKYLG